MSILVRVDNETFAALGPVTAIGVVNVFNGYPTVSPTQTKLTVQAGQMQINLTFLNPIEV
jgi:hypothetical protein